MELGTILIGLALVSGILAVLFGFGAMVAPNDRWANALFQIAGHSLTLALAAGIGALFFA